MHSKHSHYNADQGLRAIATSQILTLVLAYLVTNIMLRYFWEVASYLTRGMDDIVDAAHYI